MLDVVVVFGDGDGDGGQCQWQRFYCIYRIYSISLETMRAAIERWARTHLGYIDKQANRVVI